MCIRSMWVSCAWVQKSDSSNVLHSLFFFMCVPRVPATFLQIFIPGVKRSWSLSPVYSPVLSLSRLSHWPFFILTESGRREGTGVRGAEKEQVSVTGGQGNRKGVRRKPSVEREGEKPVVRENWAEERAFSVMDDLSSSRNQKPNLRSPLLAKAHNAVMQELSLD